MLLGTIVKTVKRKSHRGSQAVTTDQITTDIIACVNEAMRDVVRMLPKQFFWKSASPALSIVAGTAGDLTTATYSLASDCQEPIVFSYTVNGAYYMLRKVNSDLEWIGGIYNSSASTNLPLWFREIGPDASGNKQIQIFPIPNQSLTINYEYYRVKTADLDSSALSNSLPDLPDYIQDVVEKGALYYFLKGFDDPLQEAAKQDYNEAKMAYEVADEQHADTMPCLRFAKRQYYLPGFRLQS